MTLADLLRRLIRRYREQIMSPPARGSSASLARQRPNDKKGNEEGAGNGIVSYREDRQSEYGIQPKTTRSEAKMIVPKSTRSRTEKYVSRISGGLDGARAGF